MADLVVVGTGFASTFFLAEYLRQAPAKARVVVLEKGRKRPYSWKLANRKTTDFELADELINRTPEKPWFQKYGFGGGTCWTGNTPRMHPSDFRTKSLYGVGEDWPFEYDELEPYYVEVEERMGIAGGNEGPFPRSKPYPCPAHPFNAFDRLLAEKYPGLHIHMPSARSSDPAKTGRAQCCSNGVCSICPMSAKFQIDLHFTAPYEDPRVTLLTEAPATSIDFEGGRATGVHYQSGEAEHRIACDLVAVGAHAIGTPHLLMRSGLSDPALGRYLNEQIMFNVQVDLAGVENFDGGQSVTGLGVQFYDGAFRSERPGCLIENWNIPWLRAERGRWRHRAYMMFVLEDVPEPEKRVEPAGEDPSRPATTYAGYSAYMQRGIDHLPKMIEETLEGLPVEDFVLRRPPDLGTSIHIQGTTRMGTDPATSVVDADLRHHRIRNLLALGSGTFPTCPSANPTLTLSALSVRAARRLF